VGLASKTCAANAPLSPASAIACKRTLRLAVKASSDMAKTPFNSVNSTIKRNSMKPKRE
jgi:hypothetical protein